MPIDPSIALSIAPIKLDNPLETAGKGLALKRLMLQNQGDETEYENSQKLRELFSAPGAVDQTTGAPTPQGLAGAYGVDPMAGMKMSQIAQTGELQRAQIKGAGLTQQNQQGEIDDRTRKNLTLAHTNQTNAYVSAWDLATQNGATPDVAAKAADAAWNAQLDQDKASGLLAGISPEKEQEVRSRPRTIEQLRPMVTTPKEVAAQTEKKIDDTRKDEAAKRDEKRLVQAEKKLDAALSKPDPVNTVTVADPKDPNKSIVIDARTGKKIGDAPPPKEVAEKALPSSAAQKLFENQQNLRRAEKALTLVTGGQLVDKKGDFTQGDPNATGWKGYLPDAVLNRTDPEGTDTRAAIADLGSLIIHERSGAAVTAAESPRLKPFIPLITDDAKTVEKKLARFVEVYREMVDDSMEFFRESGYKVPELKSSGKDEYTDVASGATVKVPGSGGSQKTKVMEFDDADKEKRYQEWKKKNGK